MEKLWQLWHQFHTDQVVWLILFNTYPVGLPYRARSTLPEKRYCV